MPDECRKTRWIGIILLQRECERRILSSTSTIFGVLPIAIGLGAGAESRRPLGLAVVGGLFFSTFLTLILVPVVYTFLARFTTIAKAGEDQPEDGRSKVKAPPMEELIAVSREIAK